MSAVIGVFIGNINVSIIAGIIPWLFFIKYLIFLFFSFILNQIYSVKQEVIIDTINIISGLNKV